MKKIQQKIRQIRQKKSSKVVNIKSKSAKKESQPMKKHGTKYA